MPLGRQFPSASPRPVPRGSLSCPKSLGDPRGVRQSSGDRPHKRRKDFGISASHQSCLFIATQKPKARFAPLLKRALICFFPSSKTKGNLVSFRLARPDRLPHPAPLEHPVMEPRPEGPGCRSRGFLSCLLPGCSQNPSYLSSNPQVEERGCPAPMSGFLSIPQPGCAVGDGRHPAAAGSPRWSTRNRTETWLCAGAFPGGAMAAATPGGFKKKLYIYLSK